MPSPVFFSATGINRNIVECKGNHSWWQGKIYSRINRNIVECKDRSNDRHGITERVLIETLWNVKLVQRWAELKGMTVLIETLWNVKFVTSFDHVAQNLCINRNIVECKGLLRSLVIALKQQY